jgi:hypothetical protein
LSESDSFISEVSEEVRRDKLYAFLRRRGWLFALAILVIVGGTAAMEWRKHAREQAARNAGDEIRTALAQSDPEARAAALEAIGQTAREVALVARFARAGSLAEAGETAAAGDVLAEIAANPGTPALYQGLARLQRVMVMGDTLAASERLAALEALTQPGSPFRALALEQRAIARLGAGDTAGALSDLGAIEEAADASEPLRNRARQLVIALGGKTPQDVPEAGGALDGAEAPASVPADG